MRVNLNKPNFFIIGAPKCGTTSMASFLEMHPQIFMSHPKEIHFFNTDLKIGDVKSLNKYLSFFKKARKEHIAIGEASTFYLYSKEAVDNILKFNPDAKFIVMLRNPIEMVTSYHAEMCWSGLESIDNFEEAWASRNSGLDDQKVGFACKDINLLRYQLICNIGSQVERLLEKVGRKNVHFVILDDIKLDAKKECREVLEFLGVTSDFEYDLPHLNSNRKYKNKFFRKVMWILGRVRKYLILPRQTTKISSLIHQINSKPFNHQKISVKLNVELTESFYDEIALLSSILNRNFSYWLKA